METLQNPKCLKQPNEVSLPMWIKIVMVLNLGRVFPSLCKEVALNYWQRALGQGLKLHSLLWN